MAMSISWPFAKKVLAILAWITVVPAGVVTLGVLAWVPYDLYLSHQNNRAHARLKLGMTAGEVLQIIGREPDCTVRLSKSQALYFATGFGMGACPSRVDIPAELPRDYDSLQVLTGPGGRVTAFALDGESCISSARGIAKGQSLAQLPAAYVEQGACRPTTG